MLLFANYKTVVEKAGSGPNAKNKASGGKRVLYTTHHTCWDAKNRFDLPEELRVRLEDGELDLDGMQLAAVMVSVDEQAGDFLSYGEQDVYLRADRQIYRRMEYWMESAVEEAFGISSAEYMQDDEMGALFFLSPADSCGDYQLCVQETKELPGTQIDVVDRLSVS